MRTPRPGFLHATLTFALTLAGCVGGSDQGTYPDAAPSPAGDALPDQQLGIGDVSTDGNLGGAPGDATANPGDTGTGGAPTTDARTDTDAAPTADQGPNPDQGPPADAFSPTPDTFVPPTPDAFVPPIPDAAPSCEVPAPAGCPAACADPDGACPTDIVTLRGLVALEMPARVEGIVTALRYAPGVPGTPTHVAIQMAEDAPEYAGPANSGLWVFLGDAAGGCPPGCADVRVGDLLRVHGDNNVYFGQHQIHSVRALQRLEQNRPLPAPIAVAAADVATGGALADAYEGVVVELSDVAVTDLAPLPGAGDAAPINEFVVDGTLRVDDFIGLLPQPFVGSTYSHLAGVLRLGNGDTKLEPRGPADATLRAPRIVELAPALTTLYVGDQDAPRDGLGTPLTLRLDGPAPPGGLEVATTTDAPAALRIAPTTVVPAGAFQAPLVAEGLAPAQNTILSADLNGQHLEARVNVVTRVVLPNQLDLQVTPARARSGAVVTLHLSMDQAPPGGFAWAVSTDPPGVFAGNAVGRLADGVLVADLPFTVAPGALLGPVTVTLTQTDRPAFNRSVPFQVVDLVDYTGLVINEFNYDNPDLDAAEFVEVYNGSPRALPLAGVQLELINGADGLRYGVVNLSEAIGVLPAHGFLVVGTQPVLDVLPVGTPHILLQGSIQNGPDVVRLVDTTQDPALPIDSVVYESIVVGYGEGNATVSDGNLAPDVSLNRCLDGADTGDNLTDFTLHAPSPGASNICL